MRNPTLLCLGNYNQDAGYAWLFINELYADVCRYATGKGVRAMVSYRGVLRGTPAAFRDSPAELVEFDGQIHGVRGLLDAIRFMRAHRVKCLYLSDHPTWSPSYTLLRLAGVRRIVLHNHLSGAFDRPTGIKRLVKRLRHVIPGSTPDVVIAVSDFVAERTCDVNLVDRARVRRIWNSVRVQPQTSAARRLLRDEFDIPANHLVVGCCARANEYKGIPGLIQAVQELRARGASVTLVYFGDGPDLQKWRERFDGAGVIFAGYREDAACLMAGVDVAVAPSVWAEAFGMAALEPMAHGIPVIASRIGGLVEVVEHGETGLLVPPGDIPALANALRLLLSDPSMRKRMGRNGRRRAERLFSRERAIVELAGVVLGPYAAERSA